MCNKIRDIKIIPKNIQLKNPYTLSFQSLSCFKSIISKIYVSGGEVLTGEVTPLPGYTFEDSTSVINQAGQWVSSLMELDLGAARNYLTQKISLSPCASSLLLTAIDLYKYRKLLSSQINCNNISIPLVFPLSSCDEFFIDRMRYGLQSQYTTFKIKLGVSLVKDIEAIKIIKNQISQQTIPPHVKFRFDANQAYNLEESKTILDELEDIAESSVEFLEQPLPSHNWIEIEKIINYSSVPIMLDESIFTKSDIRKASRIGCSIVKLKLLKHGGANELIDLAAYANSMGIRVVMGNGVATDISNVLELQIMYQNPHLFYGASESNGFVKLKKTLKYENLKVIDGFARFE